MKIFLGTRALLALVLASACSQHAAVAPSPAPASAPALAVAGPPIAAPLAAATSAPPETPAPTAPLQTAGRTPPQCSPADWSPRSLAPLLRPGKTPDKRQPDRAGSRQVLFDDECTDSPDGPRQTSPNPIVVEGVEIRVTGAAPAGSSRRGWPGNRCGFELRAADGSGVPVRLGEREVPAFTTITALARAGSAVWLSVAFNGYTREFPAGGNRVIAVDLCQGRVVWQSKDSISNGGLLLLGDYLIAPYGFTSEPRYVFVLDAHSGAGVQKLPVIENVCPSKNWAPNWHPGDRCDAPGQAVGAAALPRVEGGVFLVDTNTGSAAFEFR